MSDQEDAGAEIVELFAGERADADAPLRMKPKRSRYETTRCLDNEHRQLELDDETRRARCKKCDEEVDLFDALRQFAEHFERYKKTTKAARREAEYAGQEAKRVKENLKDLKRQERNAKARLDRAQAKL